MKVVIAAFNQEKALVGAFSVIVQLRQLNRLQLYTGHMLQPLQPGSVMISSDPLSPDYSDNKTNLAFTRRPIITMILIGCRLHGRSLALFFFPLGFDALCTLSPFMSLLCPFAFVYSSMNGYPLSLGL